MKDYQQRVVDEKRELDEKLEKLNGFIESPPFDDLPKEGRRQLICQCVFMELYAFQLGKRINAWPLEKKPMDEKQDANSVSDRREPERMLKWFDFDHLSGEARGIAVLFSSLVFEIMQSLEFGPERTVCLRKLLEAKEAAVRATVYPGG